MEHTTGQIRRHRDNDRGSAILMEQNNGDFTLLTANDVFGNGEYMYFNFPVKPSNTSSGTPVPSPSPLPSSIRTLVVKSVQLVSEDYKNFLIIVASEVYM
jgi:hypothetical protein